MQTSNKKGPKELYIALMSVVAWRIFWLTIISRDQPSAPPERCFTTTEITLIRRLVQNKKPKWKGVSLFDFHTEVAKLGGFLARKSDGLAGFQTTWKGYLRVQDIVFGYELTK